MDTIHKYYELVYLKGAYKSHLLRNVQSYIIGFYWAWMLQNYWMVVLIKKLQTWVQLLSEDVIFYKSGNISAALSRGCHFLQIWRHKCVADIRPVNNFSHFTSHIFSVNSIFYKFRWECCTDLMSVKNLISTTIVQWERNFSALVFLFWLV